MKKIAAIIVSYKDSKEDLENLKKSLIEEGLFDKDIFFKINDKDNVGYGEGINKILKKEANNYDFFLILNPDIKIHANLINLLLDVFEKNKHAGIVGPKLLDKKGKIWSAGGEIDKKRYSAKLIRLGEDNRKEKEISDVGFVSGTAMFIKKEVFEKIGLFDKNYFLYYEDADFCLRAKEKGYKSAVNLEAEIIHFASKSTIKDSPLMQYYLARNHLLFMEKFAPLDIKIREFIRIPKTLYQARKRSYELMGIKDYILRRFGKNANWN